MIPAEITAGDLARALGISERRVATLKAEGRIRASPSGRILLLEFLAALYRENAGHRQRLSGSGSHQRVGAPAFWDQRNPVDAVARVALNMLAGLFPSAAEQAALEAGATSAMAQAIRLALRQVQADTIAEVMSMCDLQVDPDAPEPPTGGLDLARVVSQG